MVQRRSRQTPVLDLPCTALRSLQKSGGLFDKSVTGVTHELFTSEVHTSAKMNMEDSDWLHTDALDMLSTLKTDFLEGNTDDAALCEGADLEASYFEAFTDLREFLLGDSNPGTSSAVEGADALWELTGNLTVPMVTPGEILPPTSLPSVVEGVEPAKRTAEEAFGVDLAAPTNPDHNDYILKAKKPRVAESKANDSTKPPSKAEKYLERRKKNNIASKRSRETRKQKFTEMELQAQRLEQHNEELRKKVESLEAMAKEMKETLIHKLAHGK